MHRIFLGLAVTNGSLLMVEVILGFLATGEPPAPGGTWIGLHILFGLLATMTTLMVHSIAFTYFLGTGRWVKEVVQVYRMPEWVYATAVRNKSRAFPFELGSMALVGAAAWTGAGTHARGWPTLLHLGASSAALAFNLGAYAVEYTAIVAQARLLLEVKARADRQREARYGVGPTPGELPAGLDPT